MCVCIYPAYDTYIPLCMLILRNMHAYTCMYELHHIDSVCDNRYIYACMHTYIHERISRASQTHTYAYTYDIVTPISTLIITYTHMSHIITYIGDLVTIKVHVYSKAFWIVLYMLCCVLELHRVPLQLLAVLERVCVCARALIDEENMHMNTSIHVCKHANIICFFICI